MKRTTVSINQDTYTKLTAIGKFGQSFNDVVDFLIEFYMENKGGRSIKK